MLVPPFAGLVEESALASQALTLGRFLGGNGKSGKGGWSLWLGEWGYTASGLGMGPDMMSVI